MSATTTTKKFGKGERKVVRPRAPRFYAAEAVPAARFPRNPNVVHTPKLRASITPGTIVILLAGRFRGKRVIVLKQLPSGLLLVNGPYKVNGVPLRRVNQAYVIATSTKVDVSGVNVEKFNDAYFKKPRTPKAQKNADGFFDDKQNKSKGPNDERKADQKAVDAALTGALNAPLLARYLRARFQLVDGQYPHNLHF